MNPLYCECDCHFDCRGECGCTKCQIDYEEFIKEREIEVNSTACKDCKKEINYGTGRPPVRCGPCQEEARRVYWRNNQ